MSARHSCKPEKGGVIVMCSRLSPCADCKQGACVACRQTCQLAYSPPRDVNGGVWTLQGMCSTCMAS